MSEPGREEPEAVSEPTPGFDLIDEVDRPEPVTGGGPLETELVTVDDLVPEPEPDPPPLAAAAAAMPLPEPKPPERPSWCWETWVLIACLVGMGWAVGGEGGTRSAQLLEAGALVEGAHRRLGDAWRLVEATFVHGGTMPLLVSLFLLLVAGSALERMAGRGPLLFLFVVGGAGVNTVRAALESIRSLQLLAGAWPAAVVVAGAAISLAARHRRPLLPVVLALLIEVGILLTIASGQGIATAPLQAVLASALVLGLLLGLLLRQRRPGELEAQGCLLALLAVAALGLAGLGRPARSGQPRRPPPPWSAPPPAPELAEGLHVRRLEGLGVQVSLPPGWRQNPAPPECPRCGEDMPGGEEKRACPGCRKEVKPREPLHLLFFGLGEGRRVRLVSFPRGPFDGPDTEVVRTLARLAGNPRASGFLDLVQLEERSFAGALGQGHLAVLDTRLAQGNEAMIWRMYSFVGPKRTVRVDGFHPPRDDPREDAADVALFDAIAASVKELGE